MVTVLAELRPKEQSAVQPLALGWESEWAFIGSLAFHKKYPDQATGERKPDYLDYVSRAAPFAVVGGQSITKLMMFTNRERTVEKYFFKDSELKFLIKTEGKEFRQTAVFRCQTEIGKEQYDWCKRKIE